MTYGIMTLIGGMFIFYWITFLLQMSIGGILSLVHRYIYNDNYILVKIK